MNLTVTADAVRTFTSEWGFREGDYIRIYSRYGGGASAEGSFSLGIERKSPIDIALSTMTAGVTFYIEQSDIWFLDGRDLTIGYDDSLEEIITHLS